MEVMVIEKKAFLQLESQLNDLLAQAQKAVQAYPQLLQEKKWLDTQEVCQLLGISKRSLQHYKNRGLLPYSSIHRKNYYKRSDVLNLLESQTSKTEI